MVVRPISRCRLESSSHTCSVNGNTADNENDAGRGLGRSENMGVQAESAGTLASLKVYGRRRPSRFASRSVASLFEVGGIAVSYITPRKRAGMTDSA